jgi:hypothetical protein
MLRQNVEAMIEQGFSYIESYRAGDHPLTKIPPQLGPSHVRVPA